MEEPKEGSESRCGHPPKRQALHYQSITQMLQNNTVTIDSQHLNHCHLKVNKRHFFFFSS